MAAWETVPTPRNKLSKAGFLPCSQPPKQPDMELESAADPEGWTCHASETAGTPKFFSPFYRQNDDTPWSTIRVEWFSPAVQRNLKTGTGPLPWEAWHCKNRLQGCHGRRMRTGNCSLVRGLVRASRGSAGARVGISGPTGIVTMRQEGFPMSFLGQLDPSGWLAWLRMLYKDHPVPLTVPWHEGWCWEQFLENSGKERRISRHKNWGSMGL